MNKTVLSADLNLIQALLNCPEGEEWELLKRHEQLINPEFLQVMSQVIISLASEGAIEDAEKLRHWEKKLAQVINPAPPSATHPPSNSPPQHSPYPTPYLNLIQALLDCPEGQEATLLKANQALVNLELVQVMQSVSAQLETKGNHQEANFLRHWAQQIDRALQQPHQVPPQQVPHVPTERLAYQQNGHHVPPPNNWQEILNPGMTHTAEAPAAKQDEQTEMPLVIQHAHYDPLPSPWDGEQSKSVPAATPSFTLPTVSQVPPPAEPLSIAKPPIESQLAAIVEGLTQLEKTIADRLPPTDPLWYMEKLERAYTSNWILSTEELEQLIGVKPKCHPGQKSFQRGCWEFVKVGKLGAQVGWQVIKPAPLADED